MKQLPKTKKTLSILLIIVLVGGLLGGAAYEYHLHKPKPGITASQALKQRDAAVSLLDTREAIHQVTEAKLNERLANQTNIITSVCASLKTTRVTNANCQ